jgi:branched-chain amino acid transport system ATP-binding protein
MLKVKGIDVFYGDLQVLWEVSFEVKEKEILVLVGANGAGKSTTIRTFLPPTSRRKHNWQSAWTRHFLQRDCTRYRHMPEGRGSFSDDVKRT